MAYYNITRFRVGAETRMYNLIHTNIIFGETTAAEDIASLGTRRVGA